jgi:hypothetical protein
VYQWCGFKRKLTESEIKLLKNGLKFTPTPNEDKTLLGADIDVFFVDD